MTAPTDRQDMTAAMERAEPIASTDPKEPIDPMERAEPTLPMDSTEFFEPMDSTDSEDHRDITECSVTVPASPLSPGCSCRQCPNPNRVCFPSHGADLRGMRPVLQGLIQTAHGPCQ